MAASEHGAGFKLRILHFNDVYSIGEKPEGKPCGGIPRFQTLIKARRQQAAEDGVACLTCFSGDALFPSTLSTLTQAKQMVDALNLTIGDHGVSGVGNHDGEHAETPARILEAGPAVLGQPAVGAAPASVPARPPP